MKTNQGKLIKKYHESTNDMNKLEVFFFEVKNSIFSVLYVLLQDNEDNQSLVKISIVIFLNYIQIIAFAFDSSVLSIWKANSILSNFISFLDFFNLSKYFNLFLSSTFFYVQYSILVFIILLIFVDIIYVAISFKRKEFRMIWPLKFLKTFVNLAITVLFLPIISVFAEIVN